MDSASEQQVAHRVVIELHRCIDSYWLAEPTWGCRRCLVLVPPSNEREVALTLPTPEARAARKPPLAQ